MAGFVIVRFVGDLRKALSEGLTPAIGDASSVAPKPGPCRTELTFPRESDQRKWNVLDTALALVDAEGGDRSEAMRRLTARVALRRDMTLAAVANLPLADFVATLQPKAAPELQPNPANPTDTAGGAEHPTATRPQDAAHNDPQAKPAGDTQHIAPAAYLTPRRLSELFRVPHDALRSRLRRWQRKNPAGGWMETTGRKQNEPKWLYQVAAVQHIIDKLRRTTSETTSKRPAGKS